MIEIVFISDTEKAYLHFWVLLFYKKVKPIYSMGIRVLPLTISILISETYLSLS